MGGNPSYELFQIKGAVRLSDGSVVAMVAGSLEARKFGPDGTHQWTAGRGGEGPLEFRLPALLPTCSNDDRIVIHDGVARRITLLDPKDGSLQEDYRLDTEDRTPYSQIQCSPSGRMVFTTFGTNRSDRPSEGGSYRWRMGLYSIDGEDSPLRRIRDGFFGAERWVLLSKGRFSGERPQIWGRDAFFAVTNDGVWLGTSDEHHIEFLDWTGETQQEIWWEGRDLTVTETDLQGYREFVRRRYADRPGDWQAAFERRIARDMLHLPGTFPAYSDLKQIGDQTWVKDYWRPGESDQHWTGFSSDGTPIGTMTLPAYLNIQQFGPDAEWLLAITRNRMDIERLVVYELESTREAGVR